MLGGTRNTRSRLATGRVPWVDTARAATVIAVVAFHVYIWNFTVLDVPPTDASHIFWGFASKVLGAVRMPLLLVVSGILASNKVRQGFANGRVLGSSARNYYLYVVWLTVYWLVGLALAGTSPPNQIAGSDNLALQLVVPDTTLWFIYGLAVYVPVLTLIRKVPAAIVLTALALLNVGASVLVVSPEPLWVKVIRLAVFFAVGVYGRDVIFKLAETRKIMLATAGLAAATVLAALSTLEAPEAAIAFLYMLRSIALAATFIGGVALAARMPCVAKVGHKLGSKTLGIYVLHLIFVTLLGALLTGPLQGWARSIASNTTLSMLFPVCTTAAVILACVLTEQLMTGSRLGFLLSAPGNLLRIRKGSSGSF